MLDMQHLGNYVLTEQLRQDAIGTVHRGVHAPSNDPVTIRILNETFGKDPEQVARFHRAVEALRHVEHPGIPGIRDHGESPQGLYLVTDSLTGETLAARLQREQKLPLEETQRIVGAAASALAAAHRERLVHRDLTAEHIFLVQAADGAPAEVKVLDLGLARLLDPATAPNKTAASTRGLDKRADIQALGRIAYQMLAGTVPVATSADESTPGPGRKRPARLSSHGVTAPSSVESAIFKALEPKKKRRFSSMLEFARALGADVVDAEPPVLESSELPVLDSPEPSVVIPAPEPELEVALTEDDLAPVDRPKPPPLPAPKQATPAVISLAAARARALGRKALERPKVAAIGAAASIVVLATGVLMFRSGDQPGQTAVTTAPATVARRVDVARAVPEPPAPAPSKVDEILALNQKAVTAYEQHDYKTARGLLFQADKLAVASGFQDAPVRAQTQVRLGALFVGQKKARLGRPYLARAVAINPAVRIPPGMMSPQIHKTLIATKQKARLAKTATTSGVPKRGSKKAPAQRQGMRKS